MDRHPTRAEFNAVLLRLDNIEGHLIISNEQIAPQITDAPRQHVKTSNEQPQRNPRHQSFCATLNTLLWQIFGGWIGLGRGYPGGSNEFAACADALTLGGCFVGWFLGVLAQMLRVFRFKGLARLVAAAQDVIVAGVLYTITTMVFPPNTPHQLVVPIYMFLSSENAVSVQGGVIFLVSLWSSLVAESTMELTYLAFATRVMVPALVWMVTPGESAEDAARRIAREELEAFEKEKTPTPHTYWDEIKVFVFLTTRITCFAIGIQVMIIERGIHRFAISVGF